MPYERLPASTLYAHIRLLGLFMLLLRFERIKREVCCLLTLFEVSRAEEIVEPVLRMEAQHLAGGEYCNDEDPTKFFHGERRATVKVSGHTRTDQHSACTALFWLFSNSDP